MHKATIEKQNMTERSLIISSAMIFTLFSNKLGHLAISNKLYKFRDVQLTINSIHKPPAMAVRI